MATRTRSTFRLSIMAAIRGLLVDSPASTFELRFYTGAQPANADTTPATTNLCNININPASGAFGAAASGGAGGTGTIPKAGTWSGTVIATGTVGTCLCIVNNVGGGREFQLSCGAVASGADIEFDDTAFVIDGTVVIDTFSIQMPHTV